MTLKSTPREVRTSNLWSSGQSTIARSYLIFHALLVFICKFDYLIWGIGLENSVSAKNQTHNFLNI